MKYELKIETFQTNESDKKRALKPLEEAAEIFGEWQNHDRGKGSTYDVAYECVDTIQAACNVLAMLGISKESLKSIYKNVHRSNEIKGRY